MTPPSPVVECNRTEAIAAYVLRAMSAQAASDLETHMARCTACRQRLQSLREVLDQLAYWPTDVLRPTRELWPQLAQRIAAETGSAPDRSCAHDWREPEWERVAPGISCKLLAVDSVRDRISMLVRLDPGGEYPPHRHAGVEELHLLDGELWIDDRKLYPGDYNRAEFGTADKRVWSETGCTCVLVTSTQDVLG